MQTMRIKDLSAHSANPSKPENILVITKTKDNINGGALEVSHRIVDKSASVRIFTDAKEWESFAELSSPAIKIFALILKNLKYNAVEVTLGYRDVMREVGYTAKSAYYKGLSELLEKQFLYRKIGSDDTFFINVNLFFNGDRTKLM